MYSAVAEANKGRSRIPVVLKITRKVERAIHEALVANPVLCVVPLLYARKMKTRLDRHVLVTPRLHTVKWLLGAGNEGNADALFAAAYALTSVVEVCCGYCCPSYVLSQPS